MGLGAGVGVRVGVRVRAVVRVRVEVRVGVEVRVRLVLGRGLARARARARAVEDAHVGQTEMLRCEALTLSNRQACEWRADERPWPGSQGLLVAGSNPLWHTAAPMRCATWSG